MRGATGAVPAEARATASQPTKSRRCSPTSHGSAATGGTAPPSVARSVTPTVVDPFVSTSAMTLPAALPGRSAHGRTDEHAARLRHHDRRRARRLPVCPPRQPARGDGDLDLEDVEVEIAHPLSVSMSFRLPSGEASAIRAAAERSGTNVSDWIRGCVPLPRRKTALVMLRYPLSGSTCRRPAVWSPNWTEN